MTAQESRVKVNSLSHVLFLVRKRQMVLNEKSSGLYSMMYEAKGEWK
jgi:hypothetical protein